MKTPPIPLRHALIAIAIVFCFPAQSEPTDTISPATPSPSPISKSGKKVVYEKTIVVLPRSAKPGRAAKPSARPSARPSAKPSARPSARPSVIQTPTQTGTDETRPEPTPSDEFPAAEGEAIPIPVPGPVVHGIDAQGGWLPLHELPPALDLAPSPTPLEDASPVAEMGKPQPLPLSPDHASTIIRPEQLTATEALPESKPVEEIEDASPSDHPDDQPPQTDAVITLLNETFEGSFPSGSWSATGDPTWDDDDYKPYSGSWSGWCANGGTNALDPATNDYPNNMSAWLEYGPFDLSDATTAELRFRYWGDTEQDYDKFGWYASINGTNYSGYFTSGDSGGWVEKTIDLSNVPELGNLIGQSQVWIAFVFESDGSISHKGAFIDDITVTKDTGSLPNLTPYKPSNWDDEIVVSSVTGTTTEDTVYAGDPVYIDYAYTNNGNADIPGRFHSKLYINGTNVRYSYRDGLAAGYFSQSQDFTYTFPTSGSYTLRIECDSDHEVTESNESDNDYQRTMTAHSAVNYSNITPYQPSGWSDTIVVSATTNTNAEGTIYAGDTGYIDYAYINNGSADINTRFDTDLYINGTLVRAGYISELVQGGYGNVLDFAYAFPTSGSYTLLLVCDADGDIAESNESDNSYQRVKTVANSATVNLTPHQPSGWDDKIVVSSTSGTHTESPVFAGDTSYIDYSYINNGTGDISAEFHTSLYIADVQVRRGSISGLPQNNYAFKEDFEHTFASPGSYTLRIVCDDGYVVTESNESDNIYQRTKSVVASNLPNLVPYQPSGWDGIIVVSAEDSTHTESTVYAGDVANIDYAYINNGAVDVSGRVYSELHVNGVSIRRASIEDLQQNYFANGIDVKHTFDTPGEYTLRLICDVDGDIPESNENDNSHQRTLSVGNDSLPDIAPYQPSGWDDKVVVSNSTGTSTSNTLYAGDTGYIDYAYINQGPVDCTQGFYTELYINDVQVRRGHIDSLAQSNYGNAVDFTHAFTNAGTYTLRIVCDADGEITEADESNNTYQRVLDAQGGDPIIRISPTTLTFEPADGLQAEKMVEAPAPEPSPGGRWIPLLPASETAEAKAAQDATTDPSLTLAKADDGGLELQMSIPGMHVQSLAEEGEVFDSIHLGDANSDLPPGSPDIPTTRRHLYIPAGKTATIEVYPGEPVELPDYHIYPVQPAATDTIGAESPAFEKDEAVYAADQWIPEIGARLGDPESLRGSQLQLLSVCSFQYNPARKMLRAYPEMTIEVSFVDADDAVAEAGPRPGSQPFEDLVRNLVANPEQYAEDLASRAQTEKGPETDAIGADYLIITDPAFVAAANTLRDWKNSKGLSTVVKTTNDTGTTSAQIRAYIQTAYDTWSPAPSFLLLLGDVESIPTTYQTTTERGTDLYYSTVDGSDIVPDIFAGRISVDTAAQATTVIGKIVKYEQTPPTLASFYTNAVTAAYFQDGDPYSGTPDGFADRRFLQTAEEIRSSLIGKGYDVRRIYTTHTANPTNYNNGSFSSGEALPSELLKSNGFAWDGDANDILDAINDGTFLVVHRDHGADRNGGYSITGWGDPLFTHNHVNQLVNGDLLPVVLSFNCQTGWFDGETDQNSAVNEESFCELLLRHGNGGAVAVVGATRNSYSGYNDYLAKGMIDSVWPDHLTEVANPSGSSNQLGPMIAHGRLAMDQLWSGSLRSTQYELFHIHGDPSMRMWTSNTPTGGQEFTIHNDGTSDLQISSITRQNDQPWLSFTPAAPLTISPGESRTVSVNVDWSLTQGAGVSDRLLVHSNDPDLSPYPNAVQVNLNSGTQPTLVVSSSSVIQEVVESANAPDQTIQVWNAGTGTLSYSVSNDASWLSTTPASGTSTGEQDDIQLSYQSSGLSPGTYTGTITVTANGVTGSPKTIQVSLTVHQSSGTLVVSPLSLTPTVVAGQNATSQQFAVTNSGGGTMSYTVSENAAWLSVTPTSGSSTGEQDILQVNYATSALLAGTHDATITVTAAGDGNTPVDISVRLNVIEGDDRYEENDTLANAYDWTSIERERKWLSELDGLAIQKDDDWYRIEVDAGTEQVHVECTFSDAAGDIDIALHDASGEKLASSSGTIDNEELTHTVSGSGIYYIRVHYGNTGNTYDLRWDSYSSASSLTSNVTSLSRTVLQGQNSADQSFEIWNAGGGDMSYTVADNQTWLSVSPSSGTTSGEHDNLVISYTTASLAPGSYSANITVTAPGAANSPMVIPLALQVTPGEDPYENNDDLASAWNLTPYSGVWLSNILGPGVQYDDDWFMIQIGPSDSRTIEAECEFTHADGDIDLALHDATGTNLADSVTVTDNESLSYEVPSAGTYYLRVYYQNAGNGYNLRWSPAANSPTAKITKNPAGGPDSWKIEIQSISGQIYYLEKSTTLDAANWQPVKTLTGDGSVLVVEETNTAPSCFYRFRIEPAQP